MITARRIKVINTSRILREIWTRRTVSRMEIADSLGLNKSTVTNIVSELIDEGLVLPDSVGTAGPSGGRRPVYLCLNRSYGSVVGSELRPDSYVAVAVDLTGEIMFSKSERMSIAGQNLGQSFTEILERIDSEIKRSCVALLGIGVGLTGLVDPRRQLIRQSIPLRIVTEYDFHREIASTQTVPVFPENDANCCAWGELAFHRHRPVDSFIFVLVEFRELPHGMDTPERTAVGIGISFEGRVYHGASSSAGEFRSALRAESHRGQLSLDPEEAAKVETDTSVRRKFIRELSKNLALIINTFDLEAVFLGGDIEKYQNEVTEILRNEIEKNRAYDDSGECEILFSTLGDRAVAYGAAGMMLDRLFMDPETVEEPGWLRFGGVDLIPGWNKHHASP